MKHAQLTVRRAAVAILALSILPLAGCVSMQPADVAPVPTPTPSAVSTPRTSESPHSSAPTSIAVVGDSNSTGFLGTLEAGSAAGVAWVAQLPAGEFVSAGGWAVDGATTSAMADGARPLVSVDVLVIMGGTNDLAIGVATEDILANLQRIADTVGVSDVVIAAIAPLDFLPAEAMALNSALSEFARSRGWLFIDPWEDLRGSDGTWMPEHRTDGVHTSPAGYAVAAAAIASQLQAAGR